MTDITFPDSSKSPLVRKIAAAKAAHAAGKTLAEMQAENPGEGWRDKPDAPLYPTLWRLPMQVHAILQRVKEEAERDLADYAKLGIPRGTADARARIEQAEDAMKEVALLINFFDDPLQPPSKYPPADLSTHSPRPGSAMRGMAGAKMRDYHKVADAAAQGHVSEVGTKILKDSPWMKNIIEGRLADDNGKRREPQ